MKTFGAKRKKKNPSLFTGREQQLALFKQNLDNGPDHEDFINIFNIHGQGGVGKSTLAKRYVEIAKEKQYLPAFIEQENLKLRTLPEFMAAIANAFTKQGADFTAFDKSYKRYLQETERLEKDIAYPSWAKTVGSTIVKMGMKAIKTVDGGVISGQLPEDLIAEQSGEWLEFLRKKVTNKDEIQLLAEPLAVLTPLWLQALNQFAEKHTYCIFIDTYEVALPILDVWLRKLLLEQYGALNYKILLVIGGRNRLPTTHWSEFNDDIQFLSLKKFTEEEATSY